MIQGCGRRCWPGYRPSMRAAWLSAKPAVGIPIGGSIFPVYRPEVPSPPMRAPELPSWPPAPRTRAKGPRAALPLKVPPGGRRERGDTDCAAPTGLSSRIRPLIRTPPEASEDSWRGRGGRLPGPGRAEARQSSSTTTIRPAATATATTVRLAAATPGAAAASTAAAGAANIPLLGSLEGPRPQVSVALFYFFTGLVIMSTGINPSFSHQGLFSLYVQSRASLASDCYCRDSATGPLGSSCGFGCSGANTKRCRSSGGAPHYPDGCQEMAMGKNPLGITCPNPYPRRKNTPAKKPIPMTGIKFCPNPYPCGFRVPNEFPIPTNINIKNNSSCK
jgi:hypothetical protein